MKPSAMITCSVLILSIALILSGCKSMVRLRYGSHKPKTETPGSLIQFLEKQKFPDSNIYIFRDSASFIRFIKNPIFMENILTHMIFNRQGNLLYRDTSKCQWSGFDKIKSLHPDSSYRTVEGIGRDSLLQAIRPVGLTESHSRPGKEPDFTIVVTWAKFLGRYNYRLFSLDSAVTGNRQANLRMIWLNIDMQKSWNLGKSCRIKIN